MKTATTVTATLALILASAPPGVTQQPNASAAATKEAGTAHHYLLPATEANVQWGWYDPREKPKLVIASGDTVSIETLSHSLGQIKPGVDMDGIVKLRKENDGGR